MTSAPRPQPTTPELLIPTHSINTSRLHIRSPILTDVPFLLHLMTNPLNHTYETIAPDLSLEVYDARVREWHSKAEAGEQAFFVICRRAHATAPEVPIGFSGFHALPARDSAPGSAKGSTGVFIDAPNFVGQGFAVEALRAVLAYGFAARTAERAGDGEGLGLDVVNIGTLLENAPFQGVMRKAGLEDLGCESVGGDAWEPHRGRKVVEWRIEQGEWRKRFGEERGFYTRSGEETA